MRYSMYLNAQTSGPEQDVGIIEGLVDQATMAIDAGMDGLCLTEHHVSGYNTYGNNFMFGSYLSALLGERAKIIMTVAVPPLHNPLRLAQSLNLLDILTKGNTIVGFGPGGSPLEYQGLGRDPKDRYALMFENLEVVEAALAKRPEDPPLVWKTTHDHGELRTRIMPSAYHRQHPPFARATQSDDGTVWTAERGWYLLTARTDLAGIAERFALYRRTLEASGHPAEHVRELLDWSLVQKQIYIADTDEQAVAEVREMLVLMAANQRRSFQVTEGMDQAKQMALRSVVGVSPNDPEEFLRHAMIVGSPATVATEIARYEHEAGVGHMALLMNYGFMERDVADHNVERFLSEVLPRLRGGLR